GGGLLEVKPNAKPRTARSLVPQKAFPPRQPVALPCCTARRSHNATARKVSLTSAAHRAGSSATQQVTHAHAQSRRSRQTLRRKPVHHPPRREVRKGLRHPQRRRLLVGRGV